MEYMYTAMVLVHRDILTNAPQPRPRIGRDDNISVLETGDGGHGSGLDIFRPNLTKLSTDSLRELGAQSKAERFARPAL